MVSTQKYYYIKRIISFVEATKPSIYKLCQSRLKLINDNKI